MTDNNVIFLSLAAATITVPSAAGSDAPSDVYLIGVGLLIATRENSRWRFSVETAAVQAGDKEQNLLLWIADRLPLATTVIGYHIDNRLVPALINAAAHADPAIAQHFMLRLARALRNNVVDLSIGRSADVEAAAKEDDANVPTMSPDELPARWGIGQLDAVRAGLEQEVIGTWLTFVRQAGMPGAEAEQSTRDWIRRRSIIRAVKSKPFSA